VHYKKIIAPIYSTFENREAQSRVADQDKLTSYQELVVDCTSYFVLDTQKIPKDMRLSVSY